jgi:hypothetical protein
MLLNGYPVDSLFCEVRVWGLLGLPSRRIKSLLRKSLYPTICSIVVFSIPRAGFEIVHIKPETKQAEVAEEREPLKPTTSLLPLYHPRQSFSDKISKGQTQPGAKGPGITRYGASLVSNETN